MNPKHPGRERLRALRAITASRPGRLLVGVVGVVALLTIVGLIALWPSGQGPTVAGAGVKTIAGTVTQVRSASCGGPTKQQCRTAKIRIDEGPDKDLQVDVVLGPAEVSPDLQVDQRVRMADQNAGVPVDPDTPGPRP